MQRSLLIAFVLLLLALGGAAWWFVVSDGPPPPPTPIAGTNELPAAGTESGALTAANVQAGDSAVRQAVAARDASMLDDPEIRAGLCGFKGRVVDHKKQPVADCGVRIYRGALDSVLPVDFDLFAPESTWVPNYIAGEVKTAADGTWQLTGVWPRAFYMLFAGLGTDAPTHQIITQTPSPGEIKDLGDIVLPNAGVIVGTVQDENGDPLAGALVRAADLPGTLAAFFPFERVDPEGAVLIRQPAFPLRVIEMPSWAKNAFEHLPIPSTRSNAEGQFRLVGVVPGSNLLATTAPGYLSDVKPSLQIRAGQEKDAGTIRLKRGEELIGKVIDTAGKPVADADVLAGSTLTIVPVDLAQKLGRTNAEGRFTGQGFAAGKVTIAARRGKGHAWVLAEPQSILGDVVITLPATFAVDVTITLADGKPAKTARMQLLQGRAGNGAAEMHLMGLVPPIDLRDRRKEVAEGHWRLENLNAGAYTLIADAPGHATAFAMFELETANATTTIALTAPNVFVVRVHDAEDKPVRNAAIYANAQGKKVIQMPVMCGRTGSDGQLMVDKLQGDSLRVSAEHPKWGVVGGEVKVGEEVILRMQQPGSLRGLVRENGKPPTPGKFTISVERRNGEGVRGPLETVPALLTPDLGGAFGAAVLQPGEYDVQTLKALDALRSPGGLFTLVQEMYMASNLPRQRVTVHAGQVTDVTLEAGDKPIDGPTARLTGSLTLDGKLAVGHMITASAKEHRQSARVDERGRFDLGTVPAGDVWVQVMGNADSMVLGGPSNNLWSSQLKLTEGESRELTLEIQTASISGTCYAADGSPAVGVRVQGQGKPKGTDPNSGNASINTTTNGDGEFHFAKIAEGKWTLSSGARAQLEPIDVGGGVPVTGVRLQMQAATVVKGRLDLTAFGTKTMRWGWLAFSRLAENDPPDANGRHSAGVSIEISTGAFSTDELTPGRYRLRLHTQAGDGDNERGEYAMETLVVPPTGLADVLLRVGARVTR